MAPVRPKSEPSKSEATQKKCGEKEIQLPETNSQMQLKMDGWQTSSPFGSSGPFSGATVDGRNSAPPGMQGTLQIIRYLPYERVSRQISEPSTVF